MSYNKISIHPSNLAASMILLEKYCPTKEEYKAVTNHLRLLSIGELTREPVKEKRQIKIIYMLNIFYRNVKKPIKMLTLNDCRNFKEDLINNKIVKDNGNPYSEETKEDLTEILSRYITCVAPNKTSKWISNGREFKKWFTIRASKKTPEVLTEAEIERLYDACKTIEGKFLIALLFDTGARIEEFLNIRFEDIETPTTNFPYYKIDFKQEYSKTEGRKIGLYWKKSSEAISKYLQIVERKDNKDQIFPKDYDAVRMFLSRLGKKVLNKRVHPHIFRKSSATYYSNKLNRQQLSIRFGWKFSSAMPDVYISRAGVDETLVKEVMFNDDLNVIKKENGELKTKQDITLKEMEALKEKVNNIDEIKELAENVIKKNEELTTQLKTFSSNPKWMEVFSKFDENDFKILIEKMKVMKKAS